MPGSRLELFPNTGHFPFHTEPQRFLNILCDFIESTEPANFASEEWRQMLRNRKVKHRHAVQARLAAIPRDAASSTPDSFPRPTAAAA
jgi:hypothetical protein